ncbi:MAG: methylated-DNA--[protein]-cysteine S-methyltransferase [Alphaproteobacteria bacterium]|nr:methylated-DNA--[protein]-cysteine S-methyltransferase [Alphaproteobacteria bacterium]
MRPLAVAIGKDRTVAHQLSLHTPLGEVTVSAEKDVIVALDWGRGAIQSATPLLREAIRQLHAYFDGDLRSFYLPLAPQGTTFQQTVWRALRGIRYGGTQSYGDIARRLRTAPRAVGGACRRNPIPIIVPCHRVLAAGGRLGGFSGGDGHGTKEALLRLEGALLA